MAGLHLIRLTRHTLVLRVSDGAAQLRVLFSYETPVAFEIRGRMTRLADADLSTKAREAVAEWGLEYTGEIVTVPSTTFALHVATALARATKLLPAR